ncbi:hypothetical protein [Sandaracinus amylolyticus]|uniref:Flagella basal body P-ring formation protein FlgA C-terminal domain-containing protein n=1 Tax=Sandaracinus amylolyticus TaxID=927083 RepID=A0A0F6W821_9BACT|nr:hypothetical protein [Sandaracinus amylolyticus]AKF09702.1 hypothetical protein DB32_006851 [Sandaracinus amylolyticus]
MRTLLCSLLLVLALAASASAQARAGVAIDALRAALAEDGLELREIELDDEADRPVRLEIARIGAGGAVALLDVQVRESEREASATARARIEVESTHGLVVRGADVWADVAHGAAGLVVARDANVVAIVRTIDRRVDAMTILERVRAAIAHAPVSATRRDAPRVEVPRDLAIGASFGVPVPRELIAARVIAEGPGYARRTPRGWMVTRTAQGALTVRVIGVDALLRPLR